ncbi:hypothetical protein Tco_0467842 [Tanacetum coccineum]
MPYTTLSSSPSSPQFHRLHLLHDDTTLAEITPYNRPTTPLKGCVWLGIETKGVRWLSWNNSLGCIDLGAFGMSRTSKVRWLDSAATRGGCSFGCFKGAQLCCGFIEEGAWVGRSLRERLVVGLGAEGTVWGRTAAGLNAQGVRLAVKTAHGCLWLNSHAQGRGLLGLAAKAGVRAFECVDTEIK